MATKKIIKDVDIFFEAGKFRKTNVMVIEDSGIEL